MRIAFRADASSQIGSGHIMRCLTLANKLCENGADITFICRDHNGHLFELIEASNHRLIRLPSSTSSTDGDSPHAKWLGATQEKDADQTVEALKVLGHLDWLIVDHYALDVKWETAMRSYAKCIMVIDDLADRKHDCDLLLDQNLHHDMEARYEKLVPLTCKKLLGPKYALLRPEFREARDKLKVRDGSVKRVFVFFGGSDAANETGKTLRAIKLLGKKNVAIDVIVGATNPHQQDIASLCAALPKARLYRQANNIAELMARADLSIGAGGGTMWERCCLGLPAIVMSIASNQQSGCEAAARSGGILYLGEAKSIGIKLLEQAFRITFASPWLLASMSKVGVLLVDGQGDGRVTKQILKPTIMVRKAQLSDCQPIFNWRNNREIKQFSMGTNPIAFSEHAVWFRKALKNSNCQILIGESYGEAVGVLRFDREDKCAVISVYLVPGNFGKGIGVELIEQGTSWIEYNWPKVELIEAAIKTSNTSSISAFSEAGFNKKSYIFVKQIRN